MSPSEIPESKPAERVTIPRWMAVILSLLVFLIGIPFVHGVIPWAISTYMPRYGWAAGSPSIWNQLGLIPVALAAALLLWILAVGILQTPARVKLGLSSSRLVTSGPFSFTRNPMYLAELGLWIGWALFFGSLGVLIGSIAFWFIVDLIILPLEERGLEASLGPVYVLYKHNVPRWLGKTKHFNSPPPPPASPTP